MFAEGIPLQDWNLQAHGKAAALRETQANFDGDGQITAIRAYKG